MWNTNYQIIKKNNTTTQKRHRGGFPRCFSYRIDLDEESGQQEEADELNNPPDEVDFFELAHFSFQFIFSFRIHGIIPSFSAFW